jgi:L-lactate dehydrogenase complex protein LldG
LVARAVVSGARDEILSRIRAALDDVPAPETATDVAVARDYRQAGERSREQLVEHLAERIADYAAEVRRVTAAELGDAVTAACAERGLRRIAIPPGLPAGWRPRDVEVIEDVELSAAELDRVDGAVTGCAAAIAETGTLVLDASPICGRRALTLVPDHHICIVLAGQVVELVPEAIAAVAPAVRDGRRPITLVSGPSASSDIELSRVEGVHGPRDLLVLIAT